MAPPISVPVSDFKTRASNCALLTVSVICVCGLVVVGVMIVREYALSKNYINATCRVKKISTTKNEISCMFCGAGAKDKTKEKGAGACKASRFPCLQVMVDFYLPDGEPKTGLLHPDSLQAAGAFAQVGYFYRQCSLMCYYIYGYRQCSLVCNYIYGSQCVYIYIYILYG